MLPPSDSISHHSRKLAEFAASLQNRSRGPAPPPYTSASNPSSVPINEETFGSFDDEIDDGAETQLAPITIKIDASINVDGEGNTIVIPPSPSATPGASGSGAPSGPQQSNSDPSPRSAIPLQQLQQQQKTKSALLAQTIISTLQSSGALEDSESGKQRPLDISVNAGVNIKGCKNVVCLGVPAKVSAQGESPRDHSPGRKRRAESV
ncbi:hypothetical protein FQN54_002210 [Arachnomyces sp. PD_36]|nr:hypothetical protein FQN54_002210 [Arachnomyces sp. PD_36]